MNQTNQEITQKPPLPIKTKIAAQRMKILGIFLLTMAIIFFITLFLLGLSCIGSMSCPTPRWYILILKYYALFLPPFSFVFAGTAYTSYFEFYGTDDFLFAVIGSSFIVGILLLIFSQFIFKKKKVAWIFSVALLSLSWLLSLNLLFIGGILLRAIIGPRIVLNFEEVLPAYLLNWLFGFILYIIPAIFLFQDRKNFWKIAE